MKIDNLIPTPGAYVAWFTGPDDYDVFSLPIVGVIPRETYYGGEPDEQPSTEYEPVLIDHNGGVWEIHDIGRMSGYFLGGHLIGVTPAHMDTETALDHLARFRVPLNPHAPGQADNEEMGTLIQRAQLQARGDYIWPTLWQPTPA